MKSLKSVILILSSLISISSIAKVSAKEVFKTNDIIWGISFINENEILFTERGGKIKYHNFSTKQTKELMAPKVKAQGQGGMLDIVFKKISGKDYAYFTYSSEVKGVVVTTLARAEYIKTQLKKAEVLLETKVVSDTTRHFGSRLLFKDNYLFMTIGDRGERKYAQDLTHHNGKILRLNFDGTPAKGNPFENKKGALKEVWSYGHRNPQGIGMNKKGDIFSCEFGPRGGDELNLIKPGLNYGWPIITYGKEYWGPSIGEEKKKGMEQPIVYWTPSISPSGMVVYEGAKYKDWKGDIFLAALGSEHLRRLRMDGNKVISQESYLVELDERMRQIVVSPAGELYLTTDSGKILKVVR
ncbi:glucose/sorbosone dehydrogenase [Bacteriovorax sp. BAL6_X]|uniref:PQQ-dependent sugar dehydrogenase n=1 Tax=Bacteriovorax sp. BAL6_X TaxID=1201290 RepID=UPI000385F852|nr:PQQ-dependent sugar dehydrogenase [Bacteriovorax sp. BAL6_X]EPZ50557.1 glucose/sorbosone dehydrogenase [Bacteriovorax sp. BAL6_X]